MSRPDHPHDTVIAAATPWGRAALAVLRISGPDARVVAEAMCPGGPRWRPRRAALRRACRDGALIDEVLATWMPGPGSATGEDVVELSCHGNPVLVEALLDLAISVGARPARPGEFTRRALLNGRMDLLGAEALAALIEAGSPEGVALARAGLDGDIERVVTGLRERLLDLAAEIEARFDSPGESLELEADASVAASLRALGAEASALAQTWRAGRTRIHGARVALIGPVNAGKSSLFNRLVGSARALVSDTPGTTRDVIEKSVLVDGLELCFLDTAGERADLAEQVDVIEQAGVALGRTLSEDVDLTLIVLPAHHAAEPGWQALMARTEGRPRLVVGSHSDAVIDDIKMISYNSWPFAVDFLVSNSSGQGIDALRARIRALVGGAPGGAGVVLNSARQHELLSAIATCCQAAAEALTGVAGPVVASGELIDALSRLGELSGADVREDILDRVFARFCIGK